METILINEKEDLIQAIAALDKNLIAIITSMKDLDEQILAINKEITADAKEI